MTSDARSQRKVRKYKELAAVLHRELQRVVRPQAWLAAELGASAPAISQFLNGTTRPKPRSLPHLGECLRIPLDTLLEKGSYDEKQRSQAEAAAAALHSDPVTLDIIGEILVTVQKMLIAGQPSLAAATAASMIVRLERFPTKRKVDRGAQHLLAEGYYLHVHAATTALLPADLNAARRSMNALSAMQTERPELRLDARLAYLRGNLEYVARNHRRALTYLTGLTVSASNETSILAARLRLLNAAYADDRSLRLRAASETARLLDSLGDASIYAPLLLEAQGRALAIAKAPEQESEDLFGLATRVYDNQAPATRWQYCSLAIARSQLDAAMLRDRLAAGPEVSMLAKTVINLAETQGCPRIAEQTRRRCAI